MRRITAVLMTLVLMAAMVFSGFSLAEESAGRSPEADTILLTYCGSPMRELPAEGGSWSANLPAGLLSCFGLYEANGVLPVNIPAPDEAYHLTDEILWPRGYSAASPAWQKEAADSRTVYVPDRTY